MILSLVRKILGKIQVYKYRSRSIAKRNQRDILQLTKSENLIFLSPVVAPGGLGNIEHYYHFLFDLVLPLSILINKTPSNTIFALNDFGIFTNRLHKIFPNRIKISIGSEDFSKVKKINLIGMNPNIVHIEKYLIQNLRKNIFENLKLEYCKKPNKILLIERLAPDSYFVDKATVKGSGSSRRSILNHQEFSSFIQSIVKPPYEFHNLQLEKISFQEQIKYFDSAVVVIGQHGAGLANVIWMKSKATVIELGNECHNHFRTISRLNKAHFFLYKTSEKHTNINCKDFSKWMARNSKLNEYFHFLD